VSLERGTRLGPYEIESVLGAGAVSLDRLAARKLHVA